MTLSSLFQEAIASARSHRVASILTILIVTGMVLTVMLTTGRTVAAEQEVMASIDEAGTRTIQVRAEDTAGLTVDVLERIRGIDGIEWMAGFTSAVDATNSLVPTGTRVPVRYAYGADFSRLDIPAGWAWSDQFAYASPAALEQLGLIDGVGAIALTDGSTFSVAGELSVPDFLADFEPVVLAPRTEPVVDAANDEVVNVLLVIAKTPELVSPVAESVRSLLDVEDPTKVTVQTSEALAQLRAVIQSQLGAFSRGLVLGILAITAALVAVILYGLVMMRRKDFGRRRALGATRADIVALLLTQTALLSALGVSTGLLSSLVVLISLGDALPDLEFIGGLAVLSITAAVVAALLPAAAASRREPIKELRVP